MYYIQRTEYPPLKSHHQELLESFVSIVNFYDAIKNEDTVPYNAKEKTRKMLIEFEENFHSSIESDAAPILDQLRQKQRSFIDSSETSASFLHYLSQQYCRTKNFRESIGKELSRPSHLFASANATNFLSYILACNLGLSFAAERELLEIVFLETNTPRFVTGDQPVINLLANRFGGDTSDIIFYYPLSPYLACLLTHKSRNLTSKPIPEKIVNKLNGLISWHSHHFIVGDSDDAIRAAIKNQPTKNQTVMDVLESLSANP